MCRIYWKNLTLNLKFTSLVYKLTTYLIVNVQRHVKNYRPRKSFKCSFAQDLEMQMQFCTQCNIFNSFFCPHTPLVPSLYFILCTVKIRKMHKMCNDYVTKIPTVHIPRQNGNLTHAFTLYALLHLNLLLPQHNFAFKTTLNGTIYNYYLHSRKLIFRFI